MSLELSRITLQTVRIVEMNGDRLEHTLVKGDPFGDENVTERTASYV